MTLSDELEQINTIFIDTTPIIYYIEAHSQFGLLAKEIVNSFQSDKLSAFSSVITLTEFFRLTQKGFTFLKKREIVPLCYNCIKNKWREV